MKVKLAAQCPTLRDPVDCSLPASSVHGIFQARVLEWGAIAFSTDSHGRLLSFLHWQAASLSLVPPGSSFEGYAQSWLTIGDPIEYSPPGEGDGTPLKYSCLENPMDGGAW